MAARRGSATGAGEYGARVRGRPDGRRVPHRAGAPQSIFDLASQYAFAGYAALSPLLVAALFWKGSTKWGALAVTLWTAAAVAGVALLQSMVAAPPPGTGARVGARRHDGDRSDRRGHEVGACSRSCR